MNLSKRPPHTFMSFENMNKNTTDNSEVAHSIFSYISKW